MHIFMIGFLQVESGWEKEQLVQQVISPCKGMIPSESALD